MKHFKLMKGMLACLLSLALVFSCFTTVGAKADTTSGSGTATVAAPNPVSAEYNWADNKITSSNQTAYVYVLKAEKGNTIKAGASANGQLAKGEISLTDLKVKANNKDAYFYVCDKEFEAEGKSIDANLVIKASPVKKAVVTVDYTKADDKESCDVISATATDKNKKKIENIEVFWSTEANGTYFKVTDKTASSTRKYADGKTSAPNGFDGKTLVETLEAGGGVIYAKIAGVDGGSGSAQFASKAIKVKIAKQGKAPNVKVDVKKDTFSIKNGMDFALFTKDKEEYVLAGTWTTVLPMLKDAATKTLEASIVPTSKYLPLGKKAENAKKVETDGKISYTSVKIKGLGFDTYKDALVSSVSGGVLDEDTEYYVGVRTSATEKKPASAVTYFKYSEKAEAPIVYTESKVKGQYLVASGSEFAKKGFVIGTIANFNGENGTEGYDDSFKLKTSNSGADTAAASYEYTVVKASDYNSGSGANIDWASVAWKKLDPAKTKINGKIKSKYLDLSGKKVEATLKAGEKPDTINGSIPTGIDTLILVRRAGVKGKTADDAVLASEFQVLYVVKNGKNFEIYSTTDVGEEAAPYTVEFYRYSESGEGNYAWVKDDSLTITGWGGGKIATNEYVSFPEVTNADFYKFGSGEPTSNKVEAQSGETNKGKYEIAVSAGSGAVVEKVAIREYANVKVVAVGYADKNEVGTPVTVGTVKDGKKGTATQVEAYVGTAFKVSTSGEANVVPTGYVKNDDDINVSSASGEGFTGAGYDKENKEVTVTVNTADEVTITLRNPVVKTYTVTFDVNGGTGNIASATTDKDGKIKAPNTAPTAPGELKFKGWAKTKDGEAITDITAEVFKADTTLYAVYKPE